MGSRFVAGIGMVALLWLGLGACAEPSGARWGGTGYHPGYFPGGYHAVPPGSSRWGQRRWADDGAWRSRRHHERARERWHGQDVHRPDRHQGPRRENWSQDRLRRHWEEQMRRR
jgi:hypothetical protein